VKGRVLVAGFATRHVAQSAARAGYEVCAVDHFCDQDLFWYTKDCIRFEDLDALPDAMDRMCRNHAFDFAVLTSGAEDLAISVPLCGTPKERVQRFLDKLDIQHFFEQLHVPVPRIAYPDTYPVMVKPCRGAGGWRNTIVQNASQLAEWKSLYPDIPFIRQEIIEGIPASVCCVSNGTRARAIATNEQILRGAGSAAFGFSGSITPCDHPFRDTMTALAETIVSASGCIGTIGVDFVIGKDAPYAIEINPRFQGTLDTVEAACDCNLFQFHVDACAGTLPGMITPRRYAARSILFAERDCTVSADLKHLAPIVSDIPWAGSEYEEGDALVSVYGTGASRNEALAVLDKNISTVQQYMR
jgi:predicted ATP-grasp superfamily ATP-dependent carboligase